MLLENIIFSSGDDLPALAADDLVLRPVRPFVAASRQEAPLTGLEQRVVALSLYDHPNSLASPGGVVRFLDWLFGLRPPNQLADRRMEALRRYCILLRLANGGPGVEEDERIRTAGFSERAVREARRLVALGRRR